MLPTVTSIGYHGSMGQEDLVHPDDLVDATGVAQVLGLANRTSVSVYQRRYPGMPRPVVDLGRGRTKLWSRTAVASWATSADLRSPQAVASAELEQLQLVGLPLAQGVFRSAYSLARQHALGGGRKPREIARTRQAAYELALGQALQSDPTFQAETPDGWFDRA
jgi:glutathione-regulated potassium-efflux system ancillary protein KefG